MPASSTPSLVLHSPTNSTNTTLFETISYHIPASTITLLLTPAPEIEIKPTDLYSCLWITSKRVLAHIRLNGDGPLAPGDDPYYSLRLPDIKCKFMVRSWFRPTPHGNVSYLTYGIVYTVLRGLLEYMLWPDPHYYLMSFTVNDVEKGRVAVGIVSRIGGRKQTQ